MEPAPHRGATPCRSGDRRHGRSGDLRYGRGPAPAGRGSCCVPLTQGFALGYLIAGCCLDQKVRDGVLIGPTGAAGDSPGQRPGNTAPPDSSAPPGRDTPPIRRSAIRQVRRPALRSFKASPSPSRGGPSTRARWSARCRARRSISAPPARSVPRCPLAAIRWSPSLSESRPSAPTHERESP